MTFPFPKELGAARYVSLTTFRADGTAVATPVWVVEADEKLFVWTGSGTGKARRIRKDPRATLAACDYRGRTEGGPGAAAPVEAVGRLLPRDERPDVWGLMRRKYGWQLRGSLLSGRVNATLRRRPAADPSTQVFIELTAAESAATD